MAVRNEGVHSRDEVALPAPLYDAFVLISSVDTMLTRELQRRGLTINATCALMLLSWKERQVYRSMWFKGLPFSSINPVYTMDMLEKNGYVRRVSRPDDRRGVDVHLTPKGAALRDDLHAFLAVWMRGAGIAVAR
jgi:hypothetical protein